MKRIEDIVQHLIAYGWVILNMKEITPHVDPILTGFKKFISREESYRNRWTFHLTDLSLKADHGYIPPKGEGYDRKHLLMWRKNLKDMLLEERLRYEEIETYVPMLDHLDLVFKKSYRVALQIAAEFDKQLPGYSLYQHINKNALMNTHSLRLPEYIYDPLAPERLFSAQPHPDLSLFTIQMLETESGLVLEGYDQQILEYEYVPEEGTAIVFLSDKMEQLTDGLLPSVLHGVLAKAQRNRNSLIAFFHSQHPTRERDGRHHYPDFEANVRKYLEKKKQLLLA